MSVKRLVAPLCAVFVLLAIAGILECLLVMFPERSEAIAAVEQTEVRDVVERVEAASVRAAEQVAEQAARNRQADLARALVNAGCIVADGTPLDEPRALEIAQAVDEPAGGVAFMDQRSVLPSGCEIVAISVALQAAGFNASPTDIAEKHLHRGGNVETDYLGSPFSDGGGLPPCIAAAANSWLAANGAAGHVCNLTGTSFAGVENLVQAGLPVVAWTTEGLREPTFEKGGNASWYHPEHCVVAYGMDGDHVLVADSLEGLVTRDRASFAHVYEACGSRALAVVAQPSGSALS